uniref:Uncharacterized protein n=1 Tax=Lepeophtheirus salmonis TaxID=72036 RepID=A0A0K2TTU9_LEPSM
MRIYNVLLFIIKFEQNTGNFPNWQFSSRGISHWQFSPRKFS